MTTDLFAGIPVRDRDAATTWYTALLGSEPAFFPNDVEAVWRVTEHGYLYVEVRAEQAGTGKHTLFVADFDDRVAAIAKRGLEPDARETYDNGVRKFTFRDPDGNELGFGGAPVDESSAEG